MSGPTTFRTCMAEKAERVQALQIGASVLHDRWPTLQASVVIWIGPNQISAHAAVKWPGVIRVTMRYSGELVAQSLPGKPFKLDESLF